MGEFESTKNAKKEKKLKVDILLKS